MLGNDDWGEQTQTPTFPRNLQVLLQGRHCSANPRQTTSFHSSALAQLFAAHIFIPFSEYKPEMTPNANREASVTVHLKNCPLE